MNCTETKDRLEAYFEGTLSVDDKGSVDRHLATCGECKAALDGIIATRRALKGLREVEPPPWLTGKIMAQVREEAETKKNGLLQWLFYPLRVKIPIQAFATLLVVVLGIYAYRAVEPQVKNIEPSPTATVLETPRENGAAEKAKPSDKVTEASRQIDGGPLLKDKPGKLKPSAPEKSTTALADGQMARSSMAPSEGGLASEKAKGISSGASAQQEPQMTANRPDMLKAEQAPSPPAPMAAPPPPALHAARDSMAGTQPAGRIASEEKAFPSSTQQRFVINESASILLRVRVSDLDNARTQVEHLVTRLGGTRTGTETTSEKKELTIVVAATRFNDLLAGLRDIGQVQEQETKPLPSQGNVTVNIELVK
jgi:hypothetical protein